MSTKIMVKGDLTNSKLYVGETYTMRYQPTVPLVRVPTGGGGDVPDLSGRLQLRTLRFHYSRTGAFSVRTRSLGRGDNVTNFQPRRNTVYNTPLGTILTHDGSLKVLAPGNVVDQTIEVSNSSFLPCNITSADWEGFYVKRGQSI